MKLGIFDSGLGGLVIAKAIRRELPDIDIFYFGDTLHVPYGSRSDEAITMYTWRAIEYLFSQNCNLIVMACNTASAAALRKIQQEYLPGRYPGRNVIGVVVPTLEAAIDMGYTRLGLIGTSYLVRSRIFEEELQKINPDIRLFQKATPLLVPLIEHNGMQWADSILAYYLGYIVEQGIECLILGCTHYPFLKERIQKIIGPDIRILSQDEVIPAKLNLYLKNHPEYFDLIDKNSNSDFIVSDLTPNYIDAARIIYGSDIEVRKVETGGQ